MCSLGDYVYSFDTTSVMRINASALLRGEQAFWHNKKIIRSEVSYTQKILRAQKINSDEIAIFFKEEPNLLVERFSVSRQESNPLISIDVANYGYNVKQKN